MAPTNFGELLKVFSIVGPKYYFFVSDKADFLLKSF